MQCVLDYSHLTNHIATRKLYRFSAQSSIIKVYDHPELVMEWKCRPSAGPHIRLTATETINTDTPTRDGAMHAPSTAWLRL